MLVLRLLLGLSTEIKYLALGTGVSLTGEDADADPQGLVVGEKCGPLTDGSEEGAMPLLREK